MATRRGPIAAVTSSRSTARSVPRGCRRRTWSFRSTRRPASSPATPVIAVALTVGDRGSARVSHRCVQEEHHRLPRRGLLYAGGLSLFGATFADLLRLQAEAAPSPRPLGKARAVIFIFQGGGPSQHETWDPKPDAPSDIRGDYNPISTTVDGLQICEYLPKLARRARKYSIVRTMHHLADRQFRDEHSASQY